MQKNHSDADDSAPPPNIEALQRDALKKAKGAEIPSG